MMVARDYTAVVDRYQPVLTFQLGEEEHRELIEFLKSLSSPVALDDGRGSNRDAAGR